VVKVLAGQRRPVDLGRVHHPPAKAGGAGLVVDFTGRDVEALVDEQLGDGGVGCAKDDGNRRQRGKQESG